MLAAWVLIIDNVQLFMLVIYLRFRMLFLSGTSFANSSNPLYICWRYHVEAVADVGGSAARCSWRPTHRSGACSETHTPSRRPVIWRQDDQWPNYGDSQWSSAVVSRTTQGAR